MIKTYIKILKIKKKIAEFLFKEETNLIFKSTFINDEEQTREF